MSGRTFSLEPRALLPRFNFTSWPWDIRAVEDIAYNDYKSDNVFQEIILHYDGFQLRLQKAMCVNDSPKNWKTTFHSIKYLNVMYIIKYRILILQQQ